MQPRDKKGCFRRLKEIKRREILAVNCKWPGIVVEGVKMGTESPCELQNCPDVLSNVSRLSFNICKIQKWNKKGEGGAHVNLWDIVGVNTPLWGWLVPINVWKSSCYSKRRVSECIHQPGYNLGLQRYSELFKCPSFFTFSGYDLVLRQIRP